MLLVPLELSNLKTLRWLDAMEEGCYNTFTGGNGAQGEGDEKGEPIHIAYGH